MPRTPVQEAFYGLVDDLHASGDPDELALDIGCGPLESLFIHGHEEALWPDIERTARADPIFRRALRAVWAYDSPMFDQREAARRAGRMAHHLGPLRRRAHQDRPGVAAVMAGRRARRVSATPRTGQSAQKDRDWLEREREKPPATGSP